jgi:peptidyl-prolyl cis-trans isomerase D
MLKLMRDSFHQLKWILLAIVAAFVFGFVFIDMGMGGAARAGGDERAYAARVNGETVTYREFDRALYYTEQNYRQMYGGQLTPEVIQTLGLPRQVIDSLVDQRLLLQEARRLGLTATSEEVRKRILEIPILNPDGKFVGTELYNRYVTGSLGFQSAAEFEEELAREITMSKMESALSSSVVISTKTAEAEFRRATENAKIRYVLDPAQRHLATATVTPAEVDAYYKAHQADYTHGEQRRVKYLMGDFNRIRSQITPSDADIKRRYDATRENYKVAEAAHILHILVKVDSGAAPEVDAAARAKADSLVKQLRAGADFGALAKANSADPSSAANGGDMGWVEKGQTVDEFDSAAFGIPLNQISDPIRSKDFGYHIIKVLGRRPASTRPFAEVRDQLAIQLQEEMAKERAREEMTRIMARIRAENPKTPEQFSAYANDKITSNDTQWFQKNEAIPGIGYHQPVLTWTFAAKQGDIGEMIGTQRGIVIPYLFGVRPAGVAALAEIREKVETDAKLAKAREAAQAALRSAMAGAASVDAVAAKVGVTASDATVTRQGGMPGISGDTSALVNSALSAAPGRITGPLTVGNGAVVFQVVEQKKVTPEEVSKSIPQYIDTLRAQQTRSLRTVLLQRLRKTAKVDVNDRVLQSQTSQPAA